MIYLWIVLSLLLSIAICDKAPKKWYNYILLLLPIESYGITLLGGTIKPYMLFGVVIVFAAIHKLGRIIIDKKLLLLFISIIFVDILNGLITISIMQHIILMVVTYSFYMYCVLAKFDEDWHQQISDISISMVVGYGLVFLVANLLFENGVTTLGISTTDRASEGMILGYIQYGGSYIYRLRGFTIDPNAFMTAFIPGFCFAIYNWDSSIFRKKLKSAFAIVLYIYMALLTQSRMAQLFSIALVLIILFAKARRYGVKKSWVVILVLAIFSITLNVALSENNIISIIKNSVIESYTQRAGVTDEAGRFTIWGMNIGALIDMNRIWTGVGENQIMNYTELGMPCHCTWLEWICGNGIFLGTALCIWQLSPAYRFWNRIRNNKWNFDYDVLFLIIHFGICVCLTAVDHISNPNLLFFVVLMHYWCDNSIYLLNNNEIPNSDKKLRSLSTEEI